MPAAAPAPRALPGQRAWSPASNAPPPSARNAAPAGKALPARARHRASSPFTSASPARALPRGVRAGPQRLRRAGCMRIDDSRVGACRNLCEMTAGGLTHTAMSSSS